MQILLVLYAVLLVFFAEDNLSALLNYFSSSFCFRYFAV